MYTASHRFYLPLTVETPVQLHTQQLSDIPPNTNAFLYDMFNMGSDISRGWTIMHQGNAEGKALPYVILINTNTGQRFHIDIHPAEPKPRPIVWLSNDDIIPDPTTPEEQVLYRPTPPAFGDHSIQWNVVNTVGTEHDGTQLYCKVNNQMVRVDTLLDRAAFDREWDAATFSDPLTDDEYSGYIAIVRKVTTVRFNQPCNSWW